MKPYLSLAFSLLFLCGSSSLFSTTPERILVDQYEEWAEGTSRSVSIDERGLLLPSPTVKKQLVDLLTSGQVWSLLPEKQGSFLLATSPNGELFRIQPNGKRELVAQFKESHLYCLARSPQGDLYVGTSPNGKIYRIGPKDQPEIYFDPKQKYIWSLTFDAQGILYAGTGVEGKVYQITGPHQGLVYYDSEETHIRSLHYDPHHQSLLAGSASSGYLYRITSQDQGVVLFSTDMEEINQITTNPEGTIFFSAMGKASPKKSSSSPIPDPLQALMESAQKASTSKKIKTSSSSTPSSSFKKKDSRLYRLDASLYAELIWESKETIYTLDWNQQHLYAGTGDQGYFYQITPRGEITRLLQVEGSTLTAAAPLPDGGFALATSNPIQLFSVEKKSVRPGIYESKVFDSTLFARWGSVNVTSTGQVQVRTRSGNTPHPDQSWYPWTSTKKNQSQSPPARYFQVELQLFEGEIERFQCIYLPKNLPPRLRKIKILPSSLGYTPITPPPQPLPPQSASQLLQTRDKEKRSGSPQTLLVRFQPEQRRGLRTVVWEALDPNEDELLFDVDYRTAQESKWHPLAEALSENVMSWDSSGWPDGDYYIQVKAKDSEANTPEDQLHDSITSKLFTVDNTPPVITIQSIQKGTLHFTVEDKANMLFDIFISRNGKDFKPLRPDDGILDSKIEHFTVPLKKGEILFIRAEDENGNVSSAMAQGH